MLDSIQNRIFNVISQSKHQKHLLRLFTTALYIYIVGFYTFKKYNFKLFLKKIMSSTLSLLYPSSSSSRNRTLSPLTMTTTTTTFWRQGRLLDQNCSIKVNLNHHQKHHNYLHHYMTLPWHRHRHRHRHRHQYYIDNDSMCSTGPVNNFFDSQLWDNLYFATE